MSSITQSAVPRGRAIFGHPLALFIVAFGELCMAFSYFAVQGMFVLFLTDAQSKGGLALQESNALALTGIAFGGAFILPVAGGWIADRILGHRLAAVTGFGLMAISYAGMAGAALISQDHAILGDNGELSLALLYGAITLMAIGRGLATPANCLLAVKAYPAGDARIDAGWVIYYWSSGMGYLLSNLVIGTIGEQIGWLWGFLTAGGAQLIGFCVVLFFGYRLLESNTATTSFEMDTLAPNVRTAEREAIKLVLLLYPFFLIFAIAYQQSFGVMNLFVQNHVERTTFFGEIPATWFQSLLPGFGLVCAPLFSWMLLRIARKGLKNIIIEKVCAGIIATVVGMLILMAASWYITGGDKASPWFIVIFGFFLNAAEYLIMPAAAVLIGTAVPTRYEGLVMGFWLTGWGFGSLIANYAGSLLSSQNEFTFFAIIGAVSFIAFLAIVLMMPSWRRAHKEVLIGLRAAA